MESGEAEEPVVLLVPFQRDPVDRAGVALRDLALGLEVRAAGAVPALVGAGVHVAGVVHALEDLLHLGLVLGVAGADEEVVGHLQLGHQRLEAGRDAIDELLRRQPLPLRGLGDRLAVLVGAGEEEHLLAPLAHVAGQHVGGDRRVRVPQVGRRVDVVDGRGDVERHGGEA